MKEVNSRSFNTRAEVCRCLSVLLIRIKSQKNTKNGAALEKQLLGQVCTYIEDASQEVRSSAKIGLK